jgi:TPP-dependent pyruvate/acetoin dehydrogenase alpha subunit
MKTLQNVSNAELNAAAQVLQKTISEAAGKEITVAWDQDDPFAYAGDWSDEYDIYLSDWDEKKDAALEKKIDAEVMAAYKEACTFGDLASGPYPPASTIFTEVYETVPWHIQEQREELGK